MMIGYRLMGVEGKRMMVKMCENLCRTYAELCSHLSVFLISKTFVLKTLINLHLHIASAWT